MDVEHETPSVLTLRGARVLAMLHILEVARPSLQQWHTSPFTLLTRNMRRPSMLIARYLIK
jgi:hypothetical protein